MCIGIFLKLLRNPTAYAKKEKARKEKAAKMPTQEEASEYFLKNKQEQLGYLIASTLRIEKGLATLTQNQESLERSWNSNSMTLMSK